MLTRGLGILCDLISFVLCLPVLVLPSPVRPIALRTPPGSEFDSAHAIAAYEALIDEACKETKP